MVSEPSLIPILPALLGVSLRETLDNSVWDSHRCAVSKHAVRRSPSLQAEQLTPTGRLPSSCGATAGPPLPRPFPSSPVRDAVRTPFLSPLPLSDRQLKPLSKALYPESRQKNVAIKGQLCPCADRISVCFTGCRRPSACYLIGDPGTNSELALGNYHFVSPNPVMPKNFMLQVEIPFLFSHLPVLISVEFLSLREGGDMREYGLWKLRPAAGEIATLSLPGAWQTAP